MAIGQNVLDAEVGIRAWMEASGLKPGGRLPSERSLAKILGFRHYSLNRAMSRLVGERVVRRDGYKLFVEEPAAEAAREFSCDLVVARRSKNIPGYRRLAREIGFPLRIHTWISTEEAVAILNRLNPPAVRSVVFDPPWMNSPSTWEPAALRLAGRGVPIVLVGQYRQGLPSVLGDHARALQLAVTHLLDGRHTQFALLSDNLWTQSRVEVVETWKQIFREHRLSSSMNRIRFHNKVRFLKNDAVEVVDLFEGEWSKVTALVVSVGLEKFVPVMLEEFSRRNRRIPRDLSIVCLEDAEILRACSPPVTVAAFDIAVIQEIAFQFAQRAVRKRSIQASSPSPWCARVQPELFQRASTGPLAPVAGTSKKPVTPPIPPAPTPTPEMTLMRPYSLVSLVDKSRFVSIDLSTHVNRPLNFRRGWLGDMPLKDFPPGIHDIHGIPFTVLGGSRHTDCGAIVFRSATNSTGSSKILPGTVNLPVRRKAKAVYVLHGCAYAEFLQSFATYDFSNKTGVIGSVPLVALGQPPPGHSARMFSHDMAKANIQDWWPDYPHVDFPHARMAPIAETGEANALLRHVYLYTLEWINPAPEIPLTSLRITADPDKATTIGVLAVTLLSP